MMKMIGIDVSQFANAINSTNSSGGNNNSVSAVFRPGQAPSFEGMNGELINLPMPPQEPVKQEEESPAPAGQKRHVE